MEEKQLRRKQERILYIRTEANEVIASGHMMRCLAIADAMAEQGVRSIFLTAEECSKKLPEERGYEVICLNHKWDDFDAEIMPMTELAAKLDIRMLLIDSYYVTEHYMEAMHRLTRTAYIDDLHTQVWPCSILINYAVYSAYFPYPEEYPDTQLLLGCSYMPLQKAYRSMPGRCIREKVREVLLLTGGSDLHHFMKQAVLLIQENADWSRIHFTLICGAYNTDLALLQKMTEKEGSNITVYPCLPSLREALWKADMVITAGGTTLYEMAACGTPGIVFQLADNQKWNRMEFTKRRLALDGGVLGEDFSIERLRELMQMLMDDAGLRQDMSRRLQELVDGEGAARIAGKLLQPEENRGKESKK